MPINRDRKRVIGTFTERMAVLYCAEKVLKAMESSGLFNEFNLDSFRTTIVSFLREPTGNLLGLCSYSNKKSHREQTPGERTWRILVDRDLIQTNVGELEATIYHEFLHGILGKKEGHGPRFQEYERLWPTIKEGYF